MPDIHGFGRVPIHSRSVRMSGNTSSLALSNQIFGTDHFNFDTVPLKPNEGLSGAPGRDHKILHIALTFGGCPFVPCE